MAQEMMKKLILRNLSGGFCMGVGCTMLIIEMVGKRRRQHEEKLEQILKEGVETLNGK